MEGMGIKLTSVIGRHLLRHLCMFGPMAGKIRSRICNLSTYQLQKSSYNLASDLTNIQKILWVKIFINLHNWIYYLFMYRKDYYILKTFWTKSVTNITIHYMQDSDTIVNS